MGEGEKEKEKEKKERRIDEDGSGKEGHRRGCGLVELGFAWVVNEPERGCSQVRLSVIVFQVEKASGSSLTRAPQQGQGTAERKYSQPQEHSAVRYSAVLPIIAGG